MRFVHFHHVRSAALTALLVCTGCQTAQRPVSLVPAAKAPALQPAPSTAQKSSEQEPAAAKSTDVPSVALAQPQPAAALAPLPDAVADLVDRAEKEYQVGLTNYHAGKQDEAKQNFDKALDILLASNVDIRSDSRLDKEFDRIGSRSANSQFSARACASIAATCVSTPARASIATF